MLAVGMVVPGSRRAGTKASPKTKPFWGELVNQLGGTGWAGSVGWVVLLMAYNRTALSFRVVSPLVPVSWFVAATLKVTSLFGAGFGGTPVTP
jgi:hypothetical protein